MEVILPAATGSIACTYVTDYVCTRAAPLARLAVLSAPHDMLLELHGHELDSRAKVQGDLGPEPRTMHHQPKDIPQVLLSRLMATADARPGGQQLHVPMQRMRERDS